MLLRNSLHDFFTDLYGSPVWFNHVFLRGHQKENLKGTIKYLIERKKILVPSIRLNSPEDHEAYDSLELASIVSTVLAEANNGKESGMIIAGLNFGFWTAFFHTDFEDFWRKNPKLFNIFPYFRDKPYGDLLRKPLSQRFLAIKEQLRNRVFHHEPIWNQQILYRNYEKTMDVIYWINPENYAIIRAIERFPEVYNRGWKHYESLLESS